MTTEFAAAARPRRRRRGVLLCAPALCRWTDRGPSRTACRPRSSCSPPPKRAARPRACRRRDARNLSRYAPPDARAFSNILSVLLPRVILFPKEANGNACVGYGARWTVRSSARTARAAKSIEPASEVVCATPGHGPQPSQSAIGCRSLSKTASRLPKATDKEHGSRSLSCKLNGPASDRVFVQMQIANHKKDVQYLQKEASTAKDPQLKSFIHSKTLPALERPPQMAQLIEGELSTSGSTTGAPHR
jgi:hypothetical protein